MSIIVSNAILHTAQEVKRGNSRYGVTGVNIHKSGAVSSTDGRCAAIRRQLVGSSNYDPKFPHKGDIKPIIVPREIIQNPTSKSTKLMRINFDDESNVTSQHVVDVKDAITEKSVSMTMPALNMSMPPLREVFPDKKDRPEYDMISVNPKVLMKACLAAQDAEDGIVTLCVYRGDPGKPIFVIGHGLNAGVALAMPINGDPKNYESRFNDAIDLCNMAD